MGYCVQFAQEGNGFQIFIAAILVGNPIAGVTGIIQVEHGRNGINSQTVYVELLKPENRAGYQKVFDFIAAKIVNQGSPVAMLAQPRVFVLVQGRAIKTGQAVGIFGEMGRHPVQQHTDAMAMAIVHEITEIVRRSKTGGGGEIARGLITPRRIQRVFGDGHQFDMGEALFLDVIDQLHGQLTITQEITVGIEPP